MFRPRLTDYYGIHIAQDRIDFAIPFFGEDLPLCIDPFLLWKSPSQHYQSLHGLIVNSFNAIGHRFADGHRAEMIQLLVELSECEEIGLGFSATGKGQRMSPKLAGQVLELYRDIPVLRQNGLRHFEVIQLFVDGISKDRISDIAGCILKSFLIDYTIQQANQLNIPLELETTLKVFDAPSLSLKDETVKLPSDQKTNLARLLVPKHWLRKGSWISSDDYINGYIPKELLDGNIKKPSKGEVLTFNRNNFGLIERYLETKERTAEHCVNDPIFTPLPLLSLKRKCGTLEKLKTGLENKADKDFEDISYHILSTTLFPHLDFAQEQSRIESGALIRDLIFYNNRTIDFLGDILQEFGSKQLVFEIKNVHEVQREHVAQLNRYLNDELGRFGIIVTRNPVKKNIIQNTIDLWSGQRRCILFLDDTDLKLMVELFESKQRMPIEVIKKRFIEFKRKCPS